VGFRTTGSSCPCDGVAQARGRPYPSPWDGKGRASAPWNDGWNQAWGLGGRTVRLPKELGRGGKLASLNLAAQIIHTGNREGTTQAWTLGPGCTGHCGGC
jgi:hypothetical protein